MNQKVNQTPQVVGRLAPSPTGPQHVGNARTYLLAWLSVRLQGGKLVFRMEDLDASRVRSAAKTKVIEDLKWMGLDWDFGPDGNEGKHDATFLLPDHTQNLPSTLNEPLRSWYQSERSDVYQFYFQRLIELSRVFRCFCSRKEIQIAASAPNLGDEGPIYPGTCRHFSEPTINQLIAQGKDYCWRFQVDDQVQVFDDLMRGRQTCDMVRQLGDFILCRKSGEFAYQWAVTIDDHLMGVTEVVRGDDLIPSAFRQLDLFQTMGWQAPRFVHVPLVFGSDGRRLAKRHGSIRIDSFRQRDKTPDRLIGLLAHSCGLIETNQPLSTGELLRHCEQQEIDLWQQLPAQPWATTERTWLPQ